MQTLKIALRNLNRRKRRTILLGGAIAFGVMIVTLINGFANAFVVNVSDNFANFRAGHIFVTGLELAPSGQEIAVIRDDTAIMRALEESELDYGDVSKRSSFEADLIFGGETIRQTVLGVEINNETRLRDRLVLQQGSFENMNSVDEAGNRNGIILSTDVAEALNVEINDLIDARLETVEGQVNAGRFRVAAISYDPGLGGALGAYADLDYVNQLLTIGEGNYQTLGFFVESVEVIERAAATFYESLSAVVPVFDRSVAAQAQNPITTFFSDEPAEVWDGTKYRLFTLNDITSEVQEIVNLLNGAAVVILLVLFVIIMVGITNTFQMIMLERTKEIGTVRALGMHKPQVRNMFMFEAAFLALGGVIVGMLVASLLMLVTAQIYIGLDSPIFILLKNGYFTFRLNVAQVGLNASLVLVLTLVAAYMPSKRAAAMRPVDALRSVA